MGLRFSTSWSSTGYTTSSSQGSLFQCFSPLFCTASVIYCFKRLVLKRSEGGGRSSLKDQWPRIVVYLPKVCLLKTLGLFSTPPSHLNYMFLKKIAKWSKGNEILQAKICEQIWFSYFTTYYHAFGLYNA